MSLIGRPIIWGNKCECDKLGVSLFYARAHKGREKELEFQKSTLKI